MIVQAQKISFSLSYALNGSRTTASALNRISFGLASSPIIQLEIRSDGTVGFNAGTPSYYATKVQANATAAYVAGTTFVNSTENSWVTISGVIDYSTQTYTLTINGVEQMIGGSTDLAFLNTSGASLTQALNLRALNGGSVNYVASSLDNINIQIIPEPGASGLAVMGAFGVAFMLFRKRLNC